MQVWLVAHETQEGREEDIVGVFLSEAGAEAARKALIDNREEAGVVVWSTATEEQEMDWTEDVTVLGPFEVKP